MADSANSVEPKSDVTAVLNAVVKRDVSLRQDDEEEFKLLRGAVIITITQNVHRHPSPSAGAR